MVPQRLSDATVLKASEKFVVGMAPSVQAVPERLRASEVWHVEESGLRVTGKRHGLPVASTDTLTHDEGHAKRGQEAMEAAGMLGACTGTAGHDHGTPSCTEAHGRHALCHAHPLSARHSMEQQYGQSWANDMTARLRESTAAVEAPRPQAARVLPEWLEALERR